MGNHLPNTTQKYAYLHSQMVSSFLSYSTFEMTTSVIFVSLHRIATIPMFLRFEAAIFHHGIHVCREKPTPKGENTTMAFLPEEIQRIQALSDEMVKLIENKDTSSNAAVAFSKIGKICTRALAEHAALAAM
jgi:hypothetical protein